MTCANGCPGYSREEARKAVLDAHAEQARKFKEWELDQQEKGEGGTPFRSMQGRLL